MTSAEQYAIELEKRRFDHTTKITQDKIYFDIAGSVIGTAGNFIALTGAAKAGKSTFISAMISSFITGKPYFNFNLRSYKEKYKICLFDTEQSPYDFNRGIKRIENFTGYERKGVFKFFNAFLCAGDNSNDILRLINEYIINTPELAILIIDGILDCIENMNDESSSKKLIRILKRWAKKHDILIIIVLHVGKKDLQSIGHIGSASDRYAQSTLLVEKTKNKTFTCGPKLLRSAKDFEQIEIIYSELESNYIQL